MVYNHEEYLVQRSDVPQLRTYYLHCPQCHRSAHVGTNGHGRAATLCPRCGPIIIAVREPTSMEKNGKRRRGPNPVYRKRTPRT